ncbi:RabGAP/TBC [Coprinopsis marcescibilis]|uniref:RabGAP/TBC n=1 Tax=Coprinopsis marcescibilis TaxID=230819 RepID=A0A5C3LDQ4_COPMA|nr:RabGAP/TBC [Coprinopsis marcescibilis]
MAADQLPPPPSHPPTLDVDDAFNDADDDPDLPYIFSRDTVRKELEKSLPPPLDLWEDEEAENTASTTGAFFTSSASSHGRVNGSSYGNAGEWTSPTLESPLSTHFSQLSLSPSLQTHSDGEDEGIRSLDPRSPVVQKQAQPEPTEQPYPTIVIDASEDPTTRASVAKPQSPSSPQGTPPLGTGHGKSSSSSSNTDFPVIVPPLSVPVPSINSAPPSHPPTAASSPPPHMASSSSLPDSNSKNLLHEKTFVHRSVTSGPSAFEKVRSRTRPTFLPPKSRKEDDKHLTDWQNMMKQSRISAEKHRKALQDRRLAREKAIEDSLARWEAEIMPDWKVVHRNPSLRRLWWQGIPTKLRASLWEKAVGNPLALNKDHFRTCLSRAKRALAAGTFPPETLALLEEDLRTTLPGIHIFHPENGPLHDDLKQMLYAWVVSRADEGLGYTAGAARIAAMLLINLPIQNAFIVMRNLLDRHCMRSFFGGERSQDDVEAYYRIFDTLLADGMPKIYFNFKQHQISPSSYLPDWLISLFLDHLPFEACARVWDVLILEGDAFLFRAALGILAVLEPRLFFPDRKELLDLLKGENKAALEVAKREGTRLDGGKYEIYGVDEETLWDRIEHMDDWWKESTWTRLIQRELPDV